MRFTLVLSLVFAPLASTACSETLMLQGAAQGTTYHIKYVAPANAVDAKRLQADVEKVLAEIDRQMSTYRDASEISRFNRSPAGEWFKVSTPLVKLVAISHEISKKTSGAQDVTVSPLVRLWQFGPGEVGTKSAGSFRPPTEEQIQAARKKVGCEKLDFRLDRDVLRKRVEGLEVDLSSIAQGYSVDRLVDILREHGQHQFMIELGGELYASGKRSDGQPWRVAVERPEVGKREMAMAVPLVDGALATAGGSRHFFEYEGKRYSHIIDPATGRPVEHTLLSVTVAADSCTQADGWDTPLVVLGPERGMVCAERNGIAAMFISRTDAGDEVRTTTAWKKRFDCAMNIGQRQ